MCKSNDLQNLKKSQYPGNAQLKHKNIHIIKKNISYSKDREKCKERFKALTLSLSWPLCLQVWCWLLTSPDLVEAGEHPDHEAGGHRDRVPRLLQHHLVTPRHHLRLLGAEHGLRRRGAPQLHVVIYARGGEDRVRGVRLHAVHHVPGDRGVNEMSRNTTLEQGEDCENSSSV